MRPLILFYPLFFVFFSSLSYADFDLHSLNEAITTIKKNREDINKSAQVFNLKPEFIIGAILTEHTFNVNWMDRWQDKALQNKWSRRLFTRSSNTRLVELLESKKVKDTCSDVTRSYNFWYCVIRSKYNVGWPPTENSLHKESKLYRKFTRNYFNPNGLGTTFGFGQLSPLRALMVTDLVSAQTDIPRLDFTRKDSRNQLYNDILNPSRVVYYIAATLHQAIEIYADYGFDISEDLGVLVTLYNIGNESFHARKTKQKGEEPRANRMGQWAQSNKKLFTDLRVGLVTSYADTDRK